VSDTHYCENTKRTELFPIEECSCASPEPPTAKVTVVCDCHECSYHGIVVRQWEQMQKPSEAPMEIGMGAGQAPPAVGKPDALQDRIEQLVACIRRCDCDGDWEELSPENLVRSLIAEQRPSIQPLIDASKNLLEACYQADAVEELSEKIDGSLLDAMRDALISPNTLAAQKSEASK
jgi:hypothetical protein